MRILFDHNTPVPLRDVLVGHAIETAYERGWSRLSNGDLLTAAVAAGFELLVTADQNLRSQQNVSASHLAILVLPTTRWPEIAQHVDVVVSEIQSIRPGECRQVGW